MSKGTLIDQLSDQIQELQNSILENVREPESPASKASSLLNHKQQLITSLSHNLLTTQRVLQLEKEGHAAIKNTLGSFMDDFGTDLANVVGVVAQITTASAREKVAAKKRLDALSADLLKSESGKAALEASHASSVSAFTATVTSLESEVGEVHKQLDSSAANHASLQQQLSSLAHAHEQETVAHTETRDKYGATAANLEKAKATASVATARAMTLEQQHTTLTQSHSTLSLTLAELQTNSDKRIEGLMKEVNDTLGELRDARSSSNSAAQKREEANNQLQARLDAANSKIADLNMLLGSTKEGAKEGESERAKVRSELHNEKVAHAQTRVAFDEAKREMEQNKGSMLKMSEIITESRNNEEDARAELRQVKSDLTTMNAENAAAQILVKERGALIDDLEVNKVQKQSTIANLEAEVVRLKAEYENSAERLSTDHKQDILRRQESHVGEKSELEREHERERKRAESLEAELEKQRQQANKGEADLQREREEAVARLEKELLLKVGEWEKRRGAWEEEKTQLAKKLGTVEGVLKAKDEERDGLKKEMASKDGKIEALQQTVHNECMERATLLDRLKNLQQQHHQQQVLAEQQQAKAEQEQVKVEQELTKEQAKSPAKGRASSSAIVQPDFGEEVQEKAEPVVYSPKPPPRDDAEDASSPVERGGDDSEKAWQTVAKSGKKKSGNRGRGQRKGGSFSGNG